MDKKSVMHDAAKTKHFTAGDGCSVAELLHPLREELPFAAFSLAHATLEPHSKTARHRLVKSSETYYVISGHATLFADGEAMELAPGCAAALAPSVVQHLENNGGEPLEFLCIVTPPWTKEDEQLC